MDLSKSTRLDAVRFQATRIFVVLTWIHVLVAGAVALVGRNPWQGPVEVAAIVAIVATLSARLLPDGLPLRAIVAVCLTAGPILFVYAGRGHSSGIAGNGDWQIDYHMYFFGVFAMLAAYIDWRPIAIAAALTAGHHLILDLIAPANVFPEEGLDRVVLHALAVVAECSVLFWLTATLDALFKRVEEANELVEFTARETAEALAHEQAVNAKLQQQLKALHATA
jgi:methyl-accepting chemotaxis protein